MTHHHSTVTPARCAASLVLAVGCLFDPPEAVDAPPLCVEVACEHGICVENDQTAACLCEDGWQGEDCSVSADGCADAPCAHGTCVDLEDGFLCVCQPGWIGEGCSVDVDDCADAPCVHGACTDLEDGFSCACEPGWEGKYCASDIDDCAGGPCANGLCIDGANAWACLCEDGWAGEDCATNIDECPMTACVHGTCVDGVAGASCDCDPRWEGDLCETPKVPFCIVGNGKLSDYAEKINNYPKTGALDAILYDPFDVTIVFEPIEETHSYFVVFDELGLRSDFTLKISAATSAHLWLQTEVLSGLVGVENAHIQIEVTSNGSFVDFYASSTEADPYYTLSVKGSLAFETDALGFAKLTPGDGISFGSASLARYIPDHITDKIYGTVAFELLNGPDCMR
jgi:hypothetical protein